MKRIIDLTLTLEPGMRGVEIHQAKTLEVEGWNAKRLELYSHCGTHMDAPRHFLPGGAAMAEQPLHACMGPALVVDLTPVQPRELLTVDRLAPQAEAVGLTLQLETGFESTLALADPVTNANTMDNRNICFTPGRG